MTYPISDSEESNDYAKSVFLVYSGLNHLPLRFLFPDASPIRKRTYEKFSYLFCIIEYVLLG